MEILKIGLILGIVGHAINMWCYRVLSITPNGKLSFSTMNDINDPKKMAALYEGVDPSVPMNSAVFGAFALFYTILDIFPSLVLLGHTQIF